MSDTPVGPLVSHASLHHAIMEFFVEHGFAPEPTTLADQLGAGVGEVEAGLRALEDYHGVVLHPGTSRVWVMHPFSDAPTNFLIRRDDREWWAPCAWCALGAATLLGGDLEIVTTLGAAGDQVTLGIGDGRLQDTRFFVHFLVPMSRVWDNVIYSCSTMLLFRSESDVDRWCQWRGMTRGDVQPIEVVWEMAKVWYGRHRDPDWRKWSIGEAGEIFARFGLGGETWRLPETDGRF